jgi:hypothetical protein
MERRNFALEWLPRGGRDIKRLWGIILAITAEQAAIEIISIVAALHFATATGTVQYLRRVGDIWR